MNFIKTSVLSGISTAISLLARLISTKIVAVYLGTNGMFLMGQLKDFLRLGNTIGSFGIENGIVKYVSEYAQKMSQANHSFSRKRVQPSVQTLLEVRRCRFPFEMASVRPVAKMTQLP